MDLFIDSSQKVFIAALLDANNIVFKSKIETKYKVEEIVSFFDNIKNVNDIRNIYINLGPGSFTGSRIALLYVRTLAQINGSSIFGASTFDILKTQFKKKIFDNRIFINATKNKSYCLQGNDIKLVDKSKKEKEIDYDLFLSDFEKNKIIFKWYKLDELKPIYASNPQIGDIK